ncbi:MAG: hypothetical protein ACOX6T_19260 [Myxococcales bacterium]|jgi:hypothetical protein
MRPKSGSVVEVRDRFFEVGDRLADVEIDVVDLEIAAGHSDIPLGMFDCPAGQWNNPIEVFEVARQAARYPNWGVSLPLPSQLTAEARA